jgi:peroxiredoxin/Flp pilus assembly protein TadD
MKRLLALAASLAVALTLGPRLAGATEPLARPPQPAPQALTGPQVGSPAPDFAFRTLGGKNVTLASYHGKTLVINVWATWCPPCRQEMPDLLSSYAKLHAANVEFLGVDTTEEAPIVRAYIVAKDVPYAQAIDTQKKFAKDYDIAYFPTTFVIDGEGILRARYIDVLGPQQLALMVEAAKAGRNAEIVSPLQQKIDVALADPGLAGGADAVATLAYAKSVDAAINKAEDLLNDSDAAKGNSTDLLRTRVEQAAIRDHAISSLATSAGTDEAKELLARLRVDAFRDRERYAEALAAYREAVALNPKNDDALSGISFVAGRLSQSDVQIEADRKLAALQPDSVDALVELGLALAKAKQFPEAFATFTKATALAKKHVDATPTKPAIVRKLAWTHLYAGRTYAKGGDAAHARAEFEQVIAWTQKLPKDDIRYEMYLEEGQEAIIALGLSRPVTTATVSLAPWTGADLPGSVASTLKYRLVVADSAGKNVALHASGVPKGWIASFCTDRLCSPFKLSVAIPQSGVKIIEFQLVPPDEKAKIGKVRVTGTDGRSTSSATT